MTSDAKGKQNGQVLKGSALPQSSTPRRKRPVGLILSFILMFVVPTVAAAWYFAVVASDRYAASAGFSVRSMDQQSGLDLFGGLTGMAASGSTMSDAYIIMSYLTSQDLVREIEEDIGLREIYSSKLADPLYRISQDIPIEKLTEHWERRLTVTHDTSSGIIEFEVDAYTPGDAKLIADTVFGHVAGLVNKISEQAREDALRSAVSEAELAEDRLSGVMRELQTFRSQNGDIDPATTAGARIELVSEIEGELSSVEARLEATRQKLDEGTPTVQALKRKAEALKAQISARNDAQSGDLREKSEILSNYETLQIEKTFAQQAYASAMSSLEAARVNAAAQQRYLATFKQPTVPEYAVYPRKLLSSLMAAIVFFAVWGVSSLITYSIRDHLS